MPPGPAPAPQRPHTHSAGDLPAIAFFPAFVEAPAVEAGPDITTFNTSTLWQQKCTFPGMLLQPGQEAGMQLIRNAPAAGLQIHFTIPAAGQRFPGP